MYKLGLFCLIPSSECAFPTHTRAPTHVYRARVKLLEPSYRRRIFGAPPLCQELLRMDGPCGHPQNLPISRHRRRWDLERDSTTSSRTNTVERIPPSPKVSSRRTRLRQLPTPHSTIPFIGHQGPLNRLQNSLSNRPERVLPPSSYIPQLPC